MTRFEFHPVRNPTVRMNGVCPYFTMYPLRFPFARLGSVKRGTRVLDPFCGRGTTNFAARLHGLASAGLDSNPVAAAVAQAKLVSASVKEVMAACRRALRTGGRAAPDGDFWQRCYHEATLSEICALRGFFLKRAELSAAEVMLRAVVLGILHGPRSKGEPTYLSNQMPRTYATKPASAVRFWQKREMEPEYVDVLGAVKRRAEYLLAKLPEGTEGEVRLADSRVPASYEGLGEFDLVITSPPYLGMRTYWPDQWLRNWFLGGPEQVEYARPEQITTQDAEPFCADLASVWRACAGACTRDARLIIRFGALPSYGTEPSALIKRTLALADCGWEIRTIKRAGAASQGRRQA
ncbi:MAG TPA: DNA modification methylase, partial [Verrucomicrobiota bacterium]|nr:DNA modification methylase [Verrucomicrobiota bacterium]